MDILPRDFIVEALLGNCEKARALIQEENDRCCKIVKDNFKATLDKRDIRGGSIYFE